MTAFNMCTFFNNCSYGLNNMFMPFSSFSFNNFFTFSLFNQFNCFTPNFFSFEQQTPLFQRQAMNFNQPSSNWGITNSTTSLWNQTPMSFNNNLSCIDNFSRITTPKRTTGSLQSQLVENALSYVGKVNSDKEGNRLFSNGRTNEWCADFASTIVYKTYGSKIPSDFPNAKDSGVASKALMTWAKKPQNNCFLQKPSSNVQSWIAKNVKAGDIMILDRGGAKGHTAIVTKVYDDGTMDIVEGNVDGAKYNGGRVAKRTRKEAPNNLLGFVSLDNYSS